MLADIHLENFRSYTDASFEFDKGVNIIVGPNASGKTNLLEAILVLSRGKSYRAKDSELIKFNKPWAKITGIFDDETNRVLKIDPGSSSPKILEINNEKHKRIKPELRFPIVIFEPNHLQLLSGSPDRRRDFLDDLIEQIKPEYGDIRNRYNRVLNQRNALLKQSNITKDNLFLWNIRISEIAGMIVKNRMSAVEDINKHANKIYKDLTGSKAQLLVFYNTTFPLDKYESEFMNNLEQQLDHDKMLGFTTSGPHREDFKVELNNHITQESASRGENRTIILTFKIAEINMMSSKDPKKTLILLDDVFSELDGKRRHLLSDHLNNYQVIVTTTDADIMQKNFVKHYNKIALD